MKKKPRFKKRYVLGEGEVIHDEVFDTVFLQDVLIEFPKELYEENAPKYRLVLERVGDKEGK